MANMNFGVNILPKANNTYSLGNSDYKWNIYANTINGANLTNLFLPSVTSDDNGKILKVSSGVWSIGDAPSGLPSVSSTDNGKVLEVVSGAWAAGSEKAPTASPVFTGSVSVNRTSGTSIGTNSVAISGTATGQRSFAVGSTASAQDSFAEGNSTTSSGKASHSEGIYTIANHKAQHSAGEYNVQDNSSNDAYSRGNYVEIIGNGTATNARSNARTLDWSGNERLMGDIYVGCNADSSGGTKLTAPVAMTGADGTNSGTAGYVPTPTATDNTKYLKGDGTWAVPTNTTYSTFVGSGSNAAAGLVPAPGSTAGTSKFLCEDGTWAVPNDTTYSVMTGATSSAAGTSGLVPAPTTGDVDKFLAGDGTYKSGGLPMVILSYGSSTWNDFLAAYNNNVIVYCRASSNANPGTGTQGRMAFMAYVGFNNSGEPKDVEFQYYRSVSSHSSTQMGDQVFIYKLTNAGAWSVTTREASIKEISINSNSAGSVSWSNNVVTLSSGLPKVTSSDNGKVLRVADGAWSVVQLPSASGVSF